MKKILCLCLCVLCLFLTGCIPPKYYHDYNEFKERFDKAEIIFIAYENMESAYLIAESIKILDDKEMDELLSELSKIKFIRPYGPPPTEIFGYCIKLWCENGAMVISARTLKNYDNSGKKIDGYYWTCSQSTFDTLIFKYLE